MKNSQLRFGIVGTGMIAGAIDKSANARLIAVSGRKIDSAQSFVAKRQGVAAVQGIDDLLARADVDAVYIAIPTAPKEETALAAIAAGKHVLVDKPFVNHASLLRMTDAAAAKGVAFMDATHFVLDWTDSLAFKNPDIKTGYFHRTGMATREDVTFVPTPSNTSAQVAMIQTFAEVAASGEAARRTAFAASSLKTQQYLDAIWVAAGS